MSARSRSAALGLTVLLGAACATTTPRQADTPDSTTADVMRSETLEGLSGRIAFVGADLDKLHGHQIYVIDLPEGDLRKVTSASEPVTTPAWSADGKLLAYGSFIGQNSDIVVQDPDDPQSRVSVAHTRHSEGDPSWSPTGKQIAFTSYAHGAPDIWVTDRRGEDPRPLTTDEHLDREPSWSPDGKQIAFASAGTGSYEVQVMGADGSHPRRLTHNRAGIPDGSPDWSPDGSTIAFTRAADGVNLDIYVMAIDGSHVRRLTDSQGIDGGPSWSPDGRHIVFTSERSGRPQIWVMDADGTDAVQVTETPGVAYAPDWSPA